MYNHCLHEIDFARYQRWLDRSMGEKASFLIFDHLGAPLWYGRFPRATEIGLIIASQRESATPELQRLDVDEQTIAWSQSLNDPKEGLVGWAVFIINPLACGDFSAHQELLAEMMPDLVDSIVGEYRCLADLEMMTEELGARYEELHLVYAVDQHVQNHAQDNGNVFQSLLQSTAEHLNVDVVAFVQPSQNICLFATSLSQEIHNLDLVLVEMRGDLFRFIQSSGETVVLNAKDDPRRAYVFTDMPYKIIGCPVLSDQRMNSLIVLLNHAIKPDFSNSDRKLAEVLATQLSGLSNTYLLLERMHEFNEQMAKALIEAVEAKDPYTRGHSERVNLLSMEIGKAMGLSSKALETLHWGSLLHDIGKIGIPDAILCKPGPLTKDEYTFIKIHSERSYEILHHIKQLENATAGVRYHHENFDGSGYPHGLKGENIPLNARIVAIADTYDSITSSRAYRPGRSHEVAMAELNRTAGSQHDPSIVNIFNHIVSDEPEWLQHFNIRRDRG